MAGLIPQAFIDDLLSRSDIVDVIDKRVKLRKTGRNYSALCPFHQEKTPSFSVDPDKQFYYCFGCGAGGNVIGFVMNFDHLDFPESVERLATDHGLEVPREENRATAKRQSENAPLLSGLERAGKFYQYQLRQHASRGQAVDYLKSRGVSGEIARQFMLGFAPPGWDNLLSTLGKTPETTKALFKAGLLIEKDKHPDQHDAPANANSHYYDRFRDRIIFPIRDNRGRVIAFGGRVLGDGKPKYLNSPETPVFHKGRELYGFYEARQAGGKLERVLIVEGYMDVIALAQMGIHNAMATLGTATSADHLKRLFRLVSEIVFCFDGDDAGRAAAWRALQIALPLMQDGRRLRFLFLPEGEDPDSLVRKIGKEKFVAKLDAAVPLEDFFFEKLFQGLDPRSIEGRARLASLAKPLIKQLPKGIYGQLMVDRLAEHLGLSRESLKNLLESAPDAAEPSPYGSVPPSPSDAAYSGDAWMADRNRRPRNDGRMNRTSVRTVFRKPASLQAIDLLLVRPEIAQAVTQDLAPLRTAHDEATRLLLSLIDLAHRNPNIETYTLLGYCYGSTLGGQLTQLMKDEKITPAEGMEREFVEIIDNMLSESHRRLSSARILDELKSKFEPGTR
ncbi:MAG: DNA primase [Pseudohongiellaceae bacterium]